MPAQSEKPAPAARGIRRWVQALLVLNGLDLAFTLFYVESGRAVEANPLMAAAYAISPVHFAVVKMALALLGIGLLYHARHTPAARMALRGVALAYAALVTYHVFHFPFGELEGVRLALL